VQNRDAEPLSWKERGRDEVFGREIVSLNLTAP
jgi:hypothetical protein